MSLCDKAKALALQATASLLDSVSEEPYIQQIRTSPTKPGHSSAQLQLLIKQQLSTLTTDRESQQFLNLSLFEAAKQNLTELCELLLKDHWVGCRPSPSARTQDRKTPLHVAAQFGHLPVCQLLLEYPGLLSKVDNKRRSCLHLACKHSHSEVSLLLVSKGAPLSLQDYRGNSPVHYMTMNSLLSVLDFSLQFSPNLTLRNYQGLTPLQVTQDRGVLGLVGNLQMRPLAQICSSEESEEDTAEESKRTEDASGLEPLNFEPVELLGKGTFGEVFLVRDTRTSLFYAMKVLKKKSVLGKGLLKYAFSERNVMSYIRHPFVVSLKYSFQSHSKLFLVIDYCAGGDLSKHLDREQKFSEERTRMYAAEIVLALEELHRHSVVYRDLKPENVVLDSDGHVRLTDFGLSKEGLLDSDLTKSFCGSLAYLPPEILRKEQYGKCVDWYLLGVLMYEMLVGVPPYYSDNKAQLFKNIECGQLQVPRFISGCARDLLEGLLDKDPAKRLKVGDIKGHRFFAGTDWASVLNKELPVPVPQLLVPARSAVPSGLLTKGSILFPGPSKLTGWSFISSAYSEVYKWPTM